MRGDKEKACLNKVKQAMFYENGQPLKDPFTQKTYLDMTDEEFDKSRVWVVNTKCFQSFFGLLEHDRNEFATIVRSVRENDEKSLFPDFVFANGFIEHFQVTSSRENRKGSVHVKKEREFHRLVDSETRRIETEWNETPCYDKVRSKTWTTNNPQHAYEHLVDSFKRNWEHHLESYQKYNGAKQIGIFMIEYPEIALAMCENVYSSWIDGMSQGDMREQEEFHEYRLSRDKNLLEYVYRYKDKIQYVIFVNHSRFEVVRTESIPYLIKLMPWEYVTYQLCVTTVASVQSISVPMDSQAGIKGAPDDINE